jgi:hypothetical protein
VWYSLWVSSGSTCITCEVSFWALQSGFILGICRYDNTMQHPQSFSRKSRLGNRSQCRAVKCLEAPKGVWQAWKNRPKFKYRSPLFWGFTFLSFIILQSAKAELHEPKCDGSSAYQPGNWEPTIQLAGNSLWTFSRGKNVGSTAIQLLKPKLICEATHCKKWCTIEYIDKCKMNKCINHFIPNYIDIQIWYGYDFIDIEHKCINS